MVPVKPASSKKQKRGVDFKKIKHKIGRKLPLPKNVTNVQIKSNGYDKSHVFEALRCWQETIMTKLVQYNESKKLHLCCIDKLVEKLNRYENLKRDYEAKLEELEKENLLLVEEMAQKQIMVKSLNDTATDAKSDKKNLLENDATVVGLIDSSSSMNILFNTEKQVEVNISEEGCVEASGSKRTKRQRKRNE